MYRYFIKLDYNGTKFHGWQIQPNAITVQELLNNALSKLLKENINVVGCGRTDTGVHARNFYAHFDSKYDNIETGKNFIFKLNRFLPKDIFIHGITQLHNDAHCRFDATERTYKYYISLQKDPFYHMYFLYLYGNINFDKMNLAATKLLDYTDFTSFSKVDTNTKTNNCKIKKAYWEKSDNILIFTITADRFLRNMVRAITGTLLNVGKNRISVDDFCKIIEAKDRRKAGSSAPANALFLEEVKYPYNLNL